MNGDQPLVLGPSWSWFVHPTNSEPYGIRRRRKPDTLTRWEWKVATDLGGPTYTTDDERAARRLRRQLNKAAS